MKCRAAEALIPLFIEGDLPPGKSERVRRHVEDCLACRGLQEQYRRSQQWLRATGTPTVDGDRLEAMRRAVARRIEEQPRPAPLWLAIERGWVSLRRWASQPAVSLAAVGLVVLGSVTLTRGLPGSRLGGPLDLAPPAAQLEEYDEGAAQAQAEAELLAAATPEEMAEGSESAQSDGVGPGIEENAASNMRIEIQTQDPNVRIIWFTPTAESPSVGN